MHFLQRIRDGDLRFGGYLRSKQCHSSVIQQRGLAELETFFLKCLGPARVKRRLRQDDAPACDRHDTVPYLPLGYVNLIYI